MRPSPIAIWQPCLLLLALLSGIAGCGGTDPYVYKARGFDRQDRNFNKALVDRDAVSICYNGIYTSDAEVAALAQAECGKFGKVAAPAGETFGACPLLTPVQAQFACLPTPPPAGEDPPAPDRREPEPLRE